MPVTIKSEREINLMREAGKILSKVHDEMAKEVKAGMSSFEIEMCIRDSFKTIRITLKYGVDKNEKVITGIKKISKPGLRVYAGKDELPKVLGGLGTAIISTNKGVITDKAARKANVGGEVLAFVW